MGRVYVCPFCNFERDSKKQMDFHLKYGHADIYPLMREGKTKEELNEKLKQLKEQKNLLQKEINIMKTIIEDKKEKIE